MNRIRTMLEKDIAVSGHLRLRHFSGTGYTLSALLAHSGDSWFWLIGLFILWLVDNPFWRPRAALLLAGIAMLALLVFCIKLLVRRQRPDGEWGAIYRNTDPHSFPSGHAARAVMLAIIAIGTGPWWMALLLLVWAPLVSLSRVVMGLHYVSDVVAGMLLGIIAGLVALAVQPALVALFPFAF